MQKVSIRFFDDKEVRAVWSDEKNILLLLHSVIAIMPAFTAWEAIS